MPHISRYKLSPSVEKDLLKALDVVLLKITQEEDLDAFLLALLTKTERLMLAKRLAIILLLKEGVADSEIANSLHVTRVTVSRLRFFYEARGSGYEVASRILDNEEFVAGVKQALLKIAGYAVRAAGGRVKLGVF